MRYRTFAVSLAASLAVVLLAPATRGDDEALQLLTEKGLKKVKPYFKLDEEVELGKMLREGASLRKKVIEAQKKADAADLAVEQKKKMIIGMTQQRRQLRIQIENTRNIDAYNKMVTMINELADRITLLEKSEEYENAAKAARAEANQATEEYTEYLFQAQRLAKRVQERYADLAADPKVRDALAAVSKDEGTEYQLGPTRTFLSADKTLEGLLQQYVSEKIEMRRGPGDLWFVSVMFNGKHAKEMSIDTGSSSIALPYALAKEMDMAPGPKAPEIQAQLADGTIIDCRLVFAEKVRVGPFTVENVECSVFPEDCIHAEPLLGMSYLQNFNYKIDTDRGVLVMTRIETGGGRVSIDKDAVQPKETDVGAAPPAEQSQPPNMKAPEGESDGGAGGNGEPEIILVPQEQPAQPKPADVAAAQIERFAKLLATGQPGGVKVTVNGTAVEFSPSRSGPADRLKPRLGEPDAVVDVPSPDPAEKDAKWQVWTWGKLQLLVDPKGVVRYLKYGD